MTDRDDRSGEAATTGGLNWMLPVLGALGFGIGFALSCAIGWTTLDVLRNEYAFVFPGTEVGPGHGVIRGLIAGAAGGAGLGLAYMDLKRVLHFSLAGAFGFAVALGFVLTVNVGAIPGGGLATGLLVGILGGFILSFGLPQPGMLPAVWLGISGGVWFAIAFAVESALFNGDVCASWNGWGGGIGGAVLGLSLALFQKTYRANTRSPGDG